MTCKKCTRTIPGKATSAGLERQIFEIFNSVPTMVESQGYSRLNKLPACPKNPGYDTANSLYFELLVSCMSLSLLYLAFLALNCNSACFSLILHPIFLNFDFPCFHSTLNDF